MRNAFVLLLFWVSAIEAIAQRLRNAAFGGGGQPITSRR